MTSLLDFADPYFTLIQLLALYLFTDFRWLKFILLALAFDILVTLPVTLFLRHRFNQPKETP